MNQSEFPAITCTLLKAREKSRIEGAIGHGFAPHWLKNQRELFELISVHTKCELYSTELRFNLRYFIRFYSIMILFTSAKIQIT